MAYYQTTYSRSASNGFISTRSNSSGASRRATTSTSDRWRRNQNTVPFVGINVKALGPIAHTVLVALMLAVLGLIYLMQVTKTSTYGYELDALEVKRESLISQKESLAVENARLQALERVSGSDVASAMTAPSSTEYAN